MGMRSGPAPAWTGVLWQRDDALYGNALRFICYIAALWSRRPWNPNPPSSGHKCGEIGQDGSLVCRRCGYTEYGWREIRPGDAEMLQWMVDSEVGK
jgi:hypothetical protein